MPQFTTSLNTQLNKLLVPTPVDNDGDGVVDLPQDSFIEGVFNSFSDAPDGFSEELREVTYSVGLEYSYKESAALRLGYFHEHEDKGARQYLTAGLGFNYQIQNSSI